MFLIKLLCLLLLCYTSGIASSSGKKEDQKCGNDKFYCPNTETCLDRKLRCTASKACVHSGRKEAKCFENSPGRYNYYKKETPILSSGLFSRRKRSIENTKHWFLEYRGFVYEFGSYGFQELDVNDPNYKYGPGREKVTAVELVGTSSCTRDDVLRFKDEFLQANPNYEIIANNCQDFVKLLKTRMKYNCSARKRSLDDEKKSLKANCSVPNPTSSSSMLALNWKPFASFATLILLTIFSM